MLGLTPLPFCPCSARELEKARLQLQDEVRQLGSQLLEERKRRETHEALARRLQKRVLLLTKVPASPGADPVHPPRPADPSPPRPQSQPSSPQPAPAGPRVHAQSSLQAYAGLVSTTRVHSQPPATCLSAGAVSLPVEPPGSQGSGRASSPSLGGRLGGVAALSSPCLSRRL